MTQVYEVFDIQEPFATVRTLGNRVGETCWQFAGFVLPRTRVFEFLIKQKFEFSDSVVQQIITKGLINIYRPMVVRFALRLIETPQFTVNDKFLLTSGDVSATFCQTNATDFVTLVQHLCRKST
jgi:hypothetical protein